MLYIAIPMAAALSTTHCFLPPHPGPVVLVNAFGADMGKVLIYGIIIAIPAVIIAGPILGRILKNVQSAVPPAHSSPEKIQVQLPKAFPSFMIALLPVLLITISVVCNAFFEKAHMLRQFFSFTGEPMIALLVSVVLAIYYFGIRAGIEIDKSMKWVSDAIAGIAMILLIITAGGVFKQVLQDSGTGSYIAALRQLYRRAQQQMADASIGFWMGHHRIVEGHDWVCNSGGHYRCRHCFSPTCCRNCIARVDGIGCGQRVCFWFTHQ